MVEKGVRISKNNGYACHVGNVFCSDIFYRENKDDWKKWANLGVLAIEMESYALYLNAARAGKKALTIVSISDSFITGENASTETRQYGFKNMMKLALEIASEE